MMGQNKSEATSTSTTQVSKDISITDMPKLQPVSEMKANIEPQPSVLKKSINNNSPHPPSLIKFLPKAAIPLKSLQGSNGNIFVHGPHNKIVSLQIKKSTIKPSSASSPVVKELNAAKLPGLTLIKDNNITLKAMSSTTSPTISTTNLPIKYKDVSINKTTIATTTTTSSSSIITPKSLEIKPIIVTNSPKAPTPAQAATVINPKSWIIKSLIKKPEFNENQCLYTVVEKKDAPSTPNVKPPTDKPKLVLPNKIEPFKQLTPGTSIIKATAHIANGKSIDIPLITKVAPRNIQDKSSPTDNNNCPAVGSSTLIKVRNNISELKQVRGKIKQPSLLRNKVIENLQRSPRTKGRSKSLNLTTGIKKAPLRKRKLSTASDGDIKKNSKQSLGTSLLKCMKESPPKIEKDNPLLCHEKIGESPISLKSNSSVESLPSSNANEPSEKLESPPALKPPKIELVDGDDGDVVSDNDNKSDTTDENEKPVTPPTNTDAVTLLNWKDGIGSTQECKLNFQLNEFGLIEIIESPASNTETNAFYEKPIFERECKSQRTVDYSDPLYFCKGCNCNGAAVDFLTPDFCSVECAERFKRRKNNGISSKNAKKSTNRKRPIIDDVANFYDNNVLKKTFSWASYLNLSKAKPAPVDLFLNPFPCGPNLFLVGMKLEAIDPEHSNIFCVCTVVEKKGFRLKLHFDGYSNKYDFWVNADSMDIFPPGWCAKTNRLLTPPKGMNQLTFNWPMYLSRTRSMTAPRTLFTHLNSSSTTNPFQVGMKLEADDLRNTRKVCVASVADVLDNRILIHFDGWDDSYDYWIDISSPYIHPVNWHKENGFSIVPPPEWEEKFTWKSYLASTRSTPAINSMFHTREAIAFQPGMKLEVVDKKNPSLIRPATVIMADEYEIKLVFDKWPLEYAFWVVDDSPDIHPVGWCDTTGHELEPPLGFEGLPVKMPCPMQGCRGIGNAQNLEIDFHASPDSCPYYLPNWTMDVDKSQRIEEDKGLPSVPPIVEEKQTNKRKSSDLFARAPVKITKIEKQPQQTQDTNIVEVDNKSKESQDLKSRVNHHLLCDYGPRLLQAYQIWKKNGELLNKNSAGQPQTDPLEWTVDEVADYVEKLPKCQSFAEEFRKKDIDGFAFLSMRQKDLTDLMHIKIGPAIKIYNRIVNLREHIASMHKSGLAMIPRNC